MKTPATTRPATYAGSTASLPAAVANPPRASRTTKITFTSGSLTRWPRFATTQRSVRKEEQHHRGHHDEDKQEPAVAGEQSAEGEDRPQVGDETRGEDELANVVAVESRLDHDRVDHGDRGRAQSDAGDL